MPWNCMVNSSFILLSIMLVLCPLSFHINFQVSLLICRKYLAGIFIGILLNRYIKLGWLTSWQHWIFLTLNMVFPQYWRNCLQWGRETCVPSLGQEDPLEKGMATHSRILGWRIPWTEEPGGLQSMRYQRVGHNWVINFYFTSLHFQPWIWNIFPFT